MTIPINVTVNKEAHQLAVKPNHVLTDILREEFGLTGTKKGCGEITRTGCGIRLTRQLERVGSIFGQFD